MENDDIPNEKELDCDDYGSVKNENFEEDLDHQLQKEYDEFMKQMNQEGGGEESINKFTELMSNLLGNFMEEMGEGDNKQSSDPPASEGQKKKLEEMFADLPTGNLEEVATKLLKQFMDKNILQGPMEETKQAYEKVLNEKGKYNPKDYERYEKQSKVVDEILRLLNEKDVDQDDLIKEFQKLQEFGLPPEGISHGMGGIGDLK